MRSRLPLVIFAMLMFPLRATSQQSELASEQDGYSTVSCIGAFVAGSALSIYTHELGHYTIGMLCGATSGSITLWPPKTSLMFPAGSSTFQRSFHALAGPLVTRGAAEVVDLVLDNSSLPSSVRSVGGAWYLAMRLDLPFQILTSSVIQLRRDDPTRRDDIYQGLMGPHFHSHATRNLVYGALIVVQVVDLWTSWEEITENYRRLTGREASSNVEAAHRMFPFYDASTGAWGIRFQASL